MTAQRSGEGASSSPDEHPLPHPALRATFSHEWEKEHGFSRWLVSSPVPARPLATLALSWPVRRPRWAHPGQHADRLAALVALATALSAPLCPGCAPSPSTLGFASDDPGAILPAIQKAAATRDASAVPHLLDALRSDDPAVRLMAQDALQEITGTIKGTDVGYRHFGPPAERAAAIDRWTARLRREGWLPDPADRPAGGASTTPAPPSPAPVNRS